MKKRKKEEKLEGYVLVEVASKKTAIGASLA